MGAQGTATLDFGAFPGAYDAFVDVATAGVISTSLIEAWMHGGTATADHTVDEHMLETVKVFGRFLSNGNIRIYGLQTTEVFERRANPVEQPRGSVDAAGAGPVSPDVLANYRDRVGGGRGVAPTVAANLGGVPDNERRVPRVYGQFTVAWVWN